MARNLVDAFDGFLVGKRYLLLDRDPLYTQAFRQTLDEAGVRTVRLPGGNALIAGNLQVAAGEGAVARRERLCSLLSFYHRDAA